MIRFQLQFDVYNSAMDLEAECCAGTYTALAIVVALACVIISKYLFDGKQVDKNWGKSYDFIIGRYLTDLLQSFTWPQYTSEFHSN